MGDANKPATAGHGDVTADVRGEKPIQVVCRGLKGPKREKKNQNLEFILTVERSLK